MSYSNPNRYFYQFPLFDFGGGADDLQSLAVPKNKTGTLFDYGVQGITEAFNGDTLDPSVSIGVVGDKDQYGEEFTVSNAADTAYTVRGAYDVGIAADKTNLELYILNQGLLTANLVLLMALWASTGSNLTGMGCPVCVIDWDW